eukprot:3363645-Rhodomonas_salina.3
MAGTRYLQLRDYRLPNTFASEMYKKLRRFFACACHVSPPSLRPVRYAPTPPYTLSDMRLRLPTRCLICSYASLHAVRYASTPPYALSDMLLRRNR